MDVLVSRRGFDGSDAGFPPERDPKYPCRQTLLPQGAGANDADKTKIEDHLKKGGAALVAMASDDELQATKKFLSGLNEGEVQDYKVSDDSAQKLDDAKDVPPPDETDDDKTGSGS